MSESGRDNLVLIGMPGVGKSTVGVLLAKATGRRFVDTDIMIQAGTGRSLQEIIDRDGLEAFCAIEEQYILCLEVPGYVIATGGSVIYSAPAMRFLARQGTVVLLDLPLAELKRRVTNMDSRGLVLPRGMTFEDLYADRMPRYRQWARITVDCAGLTPDDLRDYVRDTNLAFVNRENDIGIEIVLNPLFGFRCFMRSTEEELEEYHRLRRVYAE